MKDNKTPELEALTELLESVDDYITLGQTPENITEFSSAVHVKKDIIIDAEGETVKAGLYFCNDDMDLFVLQKTSEATAPPPFEGASVVQPYALLYKDKPYKIANLVWAIYAYMDTSERVQTAVERFMSLSKDPGSIAEVLITRPPLPVANTFGIMNDKVNTQLISSEAFEQEIDGQLRLTWGVNQKPGQKENPPITYIALSYEGTETKISKRMTAFDNAVYNAVSTRFYYWKLENGDKPLYITPQEIWRSMIRQNGNARPSKRQVEQVRRSMDKMRVTLFFMDISAELEAHYITLEDERLVSGNIETYLLKADKISFKTEKGKKVDGYRVTEEPILYTYNKAKDHILWFDADLLDTSQYTSDTTNVIVFRYYLLQQIQLMKNGFLKSHRVLFETLYSKTGIEPPESRLKRENYSSDNSYRTKVRQEAKKDREKISGILQSWIEKNWICGYEPVKKRNAVVGFDITPQPEKKKALPKR